MDISLASLAPTLTRSTAWPDWLQDEDRYYARLSQDWPRFQSTRDLLAHIGSALHVVAVLVPARRTLSA